MKSTNKAGKESRAKGAGKKTAAGTRPGKPGKQEFGAAPKSRRQEEDRWRELVETSAAWIWETDAAIRHTYTNAFVTRCLGYKPAEFLGLETLDLIHPDDRRLVKELVQNATTRREGWSGQVLRWRHKDGSWRHIESSGSVLFNEQGNFAGLCGIDRDITEQKQAAEDLRRSEEKYRDLFENAVDAICIVDRNQNFIDVNRRAIELFGYSREEFLSMNVRDMLPPGQLSRSEKEFAKLIESGAYEKFTGKVRKKDGSYVDVEVSSSAIVEQGQVIGSRDIIREVTERKRAEDSLRESEVRTRSIIEALPAGMHMYRLEPDGRLIFTGANPAADRILGVDNRTFIGKTIEEAFPLIKATEIPQRYREVAASGKAWYTEQVNYHDNAIQGVFEVHAFQTTSNNMAVVFEEITARQQAEENLRESEERYRQLFEAESDAILLIENGTGGILMANNAAVALYGYDREELLEKKNADLSVEPSETRRITEKTPIIKENAVTIPLRYHQKKDGTVFPVEITGRFFNYQGRAVHIAAMRDITERKRAEEALRDSQRFMETIIESAPT